MSVAIVSRVSDPTLRSLLQNHFSQFDLVCVGLISGRSIQIVSFKGFKLELSVRVVVKVDTYGVHVYRCIGVVGVLLGNESKWWVCTECETGQSQ